MARRQIVTTASKRLAFNLHLLGLKGRIEISREDGAPLDVQDLLAMNAVLEAYDVEHGLPVSAEDAARMEARASALLDTGSANEPPFIEAIPGEGN